MGFIDNSDHFINALHDKLEPTLLAVGEFLSTEAGVELENSPRRVDTGLLRNSITYALDGESTAIGEYSDDSGEITGKYSGKTEKESGKDRAVYIGTNVEYSIYVHEGTAKMTANHFLRNACEKNKEQIQKYIKDGLKS